MGHVEFSSLRSAASMKITDLIRMILLFRFYHNHLLGGPFIAYMPGCYCGVWEHEGWGELLLF